MNRKTPLIVLMSFLLAALTASLALAAPPDRTSIVDVALDVNASTGEFDNLIAALVRVDNELSAGLIPMLDGNRQFTVFAPTDAAFDAAGMALGFADGADLVANVDVELLAGVLGYHVAPGKRTAADVTTASRVRTISKGFVFPYVADGNAFLMDSDSVLMAGSPDAQIVMADVFADNGVIHVIDWVLLP